MLPIDSLFVVQGELAATAVNAPMVSAEVLAELQPFVALAQGLGTAAVQLVGSHGFTDIHLTYNTSRGGALQILTVHLMLLWSSLPPDLVCMMHMAVWHVISNTVLIGCAQSGKALHLGREGHSRLQLPRLA